ncbi:hypothetical protein HPA24_04365 [Streptococcus suis]|nr:hypothetical protein [Streptococcus suis]NQG33712.1 hypothetical protein [Streptococcus suis]NQM89626.1 hypothetical protein [Streptococcus suis]NQM95571.1 hypothetical protein [Streptococcus suis]NQN06704.1 hypothetical protein [Streptococcus suis]NQN08899.1 hypothetical protein [Streptococcus suis]
MTTADKIKYILQKTGWTRDQFATEMGVTTLSVYKMARRTTTAPAHVG